MKILLKLAIIIAALLVVANMSYAAPICSGQKLCYNMTQHLNDGSHVNCTATFCLNEDGSGTSCFSNGEDSCGGCLTLSLFGGEKAWYNFNGDPQPSGKPMWTTWLCIDCSAGVLFQTLEGGLLLTGVTSDSTGTTKTTISAFQIPCP
jgi:hypothetical protein